MQNQRRHFLQGSAASMAGLAIGLPSRAGSRDANRPIGLQLFTLGKTLEENPGPSLAQLAAIGYREIEAGKYASLSPAALQPCSPAPCGRPGRFAAALRPPGFREPG